MSGAVEALCAHLGVQPNYKDFGGQMVHVAPETRLAVLRAMGFDIAGEADARAALETLRAEEAARPVPQEVIVIAGERAEIALSHPAAWRLEAEETGAVLGEGEAAGRIALPPLPPGIHHLRLTAGSRDFTTWVLARPARAFMLGDVIAPPRIWGVSAALYGMTGGARAPIGNYNLLGEYAAAMAGHGADFLAINPIHAMGDERLGEIFSPYSPSHRAFLNTWHCGAPGAGDEAELIDYPAARSAVSAALFAEYTAFAALPADAPEKQALAGFRKAGGAALREFALFEALTKTLGPDWRDWPARYRTHDAETLGKAERAHEHAITRIIWGQWRAETELAAAQARAKSSGMRIGLYLDLAVGPRPGGAESWAQNSPLAAGASLGSPPDDFSRDGQRWGLAPLSPLKSREQGYAGFARLLRASMRHAGMIRIDHVLGLMRCFWIPDGEEKGAYVSYPLDALLAVVVIESVRNRAVVVGEDLGLVPEGLREKLAASGLYGLDVLQYMRAPDGGFADAADMRELAISAFATHDTPTIKGFFAAADVEARAGFGGVDEAVLNDAVKDREAARQSLGAGDAATEIHRRLASAPSAMVAVQLDDLAGRKAQQNLPGTVDEYPNWRLKAPFTPDEIKTSDAFAQAGAMMAAEHRTNLNKDGDGT